MPETQHTAVDPLYRHVEKIAERLPSTSGPLKWYGVRETQRIIDREVAAAAQEHLASLIDSQDDGFAILHLCGDAFYFLLLCRWRNNNELWETAFTRGAGDEEFVPVAATETRATFCVWELGVVERERAAWTAFLRTERSPKQLRQYRDSFYEGTV